MFDAIQMQRSKGTARVALRDGRLHDLWQSGSAKVMLPRVHGTAPEIVFLNSAGGLTGGDCLDYQVSIGAGMQALATTQTAERAYRSDGPPARAGVHLQIGPDAALTWLPQETILFNGAALDRQTRVQMTATSRFLGMECIVLGRQAMGETVTRLHLHDRRVFLCDGRPVLIDPLRLNDASLARGQGAALMNGARAMGVLILVAPDAADRLAAARACLDQPQVTGAASAPGGRLIVRCLGADGWALRQQMLRLLKVLTPDPLPRVWQI